MNKKTISNHKRKPYRTRSDSFKRFDYPDPNTDFLPNHINGFKKPGKAETPKRAFWVFEGDEATVSFSIDC